MQENSEEKAMENSSELTYKVPGGLSMTTLKVIAVISMLIDHIGAVLFPRTYWLRGIGRLAMPIFCFGISEGLHYSKDRMKYLLRMGLWSVISEVPFDLAFNGGPEFYSQNVMLTFFCAIAGIMVYEAIKNLSPSIFMTILGAAGAAAFAYAARFLRTDYGEFGVLLVYVLYFMRPYPTYRLLAAIALVCVFYWMDLEMVCLPAFLILSRYNGVNGRGLKYLFYFFYPFHLTILALIDRLT